MKPKIQKAKERLIVWWKNYLSQYERPKGFKEKLSLILEIGVTVSVVLICVFLLGYLFYNVIHAAMTSKSIWGWLGCSAIFVLAFYALFRNRDESRKDSNDKKE